MQQTMTGELEAMLAVLPPSIAESLREARGGGELLEVVLDLGRAAEARFVGREQQLNRKEVSREEIDFVVSRISEFDGDNRAGIERTLHRISALRNRKGDVVGLTCRVGRAIYGTVDIVRDIVESGKSVLLLGRPGVGKTTLLREVARILAEKKRVVIVDTSNEIGGDGDIPHPAVGRARRMQVPHPTQQHHVMIEAVENHMPEVIVIDEIGNELEAAAARTIAERGVQLIGTAHGSTMDNLMMNPTLADLVGGIQSVTLSDEEARRRGTQKSVLERKAPPTFDVVIEIQDWSHLAVRHDVAEAVDAILRGRSLPAELRYRDEQGEVRVEETLLAPPSMDMAETRVQTPRTLKPTRVFAYGVARNRLRQAVKRLQVPASVVDDIGQADVVLTLKSYYRKRPRPIAQAERRGVPIYVLRSNTVNQMESCFVDIFDLAQQTPSSDLDEAMRETQQAIRRVLAGAHMMELHPQNSYVRRVQHEMARDSKLISHSRGEEPDRRVRIYRR
jgi:stage III sporulation protein SpoIIIAA